MKRLLLVAVITLMTGCAKQPAQAPVPGSINSTDAWAFRVISDAQAAIRQIKGWETCSDQKFPGTVNFDGASFTCDPTAGTFPASARQPLFQAENSYNIAEAAGNAYHAGASSDTVGLTTAVTNLTSAIVQMFTAAGKAK